MGWTTKLLIMSLLGLAVCQQRSLSGGRRRQRLQADNSEVASFNCPQDFGYYPHPTDCTQYYVCVFGGALHESCTGGLVYSHELETCDWPRNVDCNPTKASSGSSTAQITNQRNQNTRPATEALTPSVGSFDHTFSSSQNHRTSRPFNGGDRSNSQRSLFRQEPNPKQSLTSSSSHFTRQSFFDSTAQQQQQQPPRRRTQRLNSAKPSTFRPQAFSSPTRRPVAPAPAPRPTQAPVHQAPIISDDAFYSELNYTDADFFYYYDDLLYDFYDVGEPAAVPSIRQPAPNHPNARTPPRQSTTTNNRGSPSSTTTPRSVDSSVPARPTPTGPAPPVDTKAEKCDPKVCRLPDCYCGGKEIPGGYSANELPQIVLLTFDDAVNELNSELYKELFENGRLNPNGCRIPSTMYVSHEWTNYVQVQQLYADGHEIASHSISHSFGEKFSTKRWAKEISGQREILSAYGGVKMEDVRGMRAPFLAIGGNKMYRMLWEQNFTYDSSMPVYENTPPSWPYTLDYSLFHDCMIPPCPTNSYPGLWQVPMVMWQDLNNGRCSMADACTTPSTAEDVYKMLIKNFERHYTTNRAPFGLYYHAAWFTTPHHKEGFIAFLDTIVGMDDVWFTTNWQLLQWMRNPTPLSSIKNFAPFGCDYPDRKKCVSKKVCNVWHKGGVRYMRTCQKCPETYPWTSNTGVASPLND